MKRLHGLDALRGVAALSVVVWHWQHFQSLGGGPEQGWSRQLQPFFWALKPLYDAGWAAVDLFFALSGFVFFWLYAEAIGTGRVGPRRFALLRFSRLYPLHFATLILVALLQASFRRQTGHDFIFISDNWKRFGAALLIAQQWLPPTAQLFFNGPAWSVSIEVMLYILFFAICRAGLAGPRFALGIAAAALAAFVLNTNELVTRGLMGFFVGGMVFHAVTWALTRPDARRIAHLLATLALTAWAVMIIRDYWSVAPSGRLLPDGGGDYVHSTDNSFVLPFIFIVSPLTIAALALREHLFGGRWARLSFLGDISYSTYLLHFPLQLICALAALHFGWAPAAFMHPLVMFAFFTALVALGALSHYGFERPLQTIIRNAATTVRRVPV